MGQHSYQIIHSSQLDILSRRSTSDKSEAGCRNLPQSPSTARCSSHLPQICSRIPLPEP
ncbi:hypothetical protein HanXRQr2_Chr04g0167351 [Helianthus annuus]|uniref:Uncharacterized protein n=1 Tax=Helianthus annuus TaxID=4232 RepID=A0A9K3NRL3_HELAN|nr:hypothetical protein HanXRQr2_Chr04g0167351 [Helianthus annuus]KAJ0931358.1 hypothetical protein HanPSC8_Chr04g0160731 [Helianthus annuus]